MSKTKKDCSYRALQRRECRYDEYLEQAYAAYGKVTTHTTDKVKQYHPFYIVEKEETNNGIKTLLFAIHDENRGLLLKIRHPFTEPKISASKVWTKTIKEQLRLREYFHYLNDTRS